MTLKEDITDQLLPLLGLKQRFAAVDLAPNEQLETGFSAIDRERNLIRIDKLYKDTEVIAAVEALGPVSSTVVVVDVPKSLSISGRWRQEEIKMHPLRLQRANGQSVSRYEERGARLYRMLEEQGALVLLYYNYWARVNYDMLLPFRSRSPQGCRALQNAIEHQLGLKDMPTNLAPSSVLESMVGAYASWSIWAGQPKIDYEVHLDEVGHKILIPKARPHLLMKPPRIRRRRRTPRPPTPSPKARENKREKREDV